MESPHLHFQQPSWLLPGCGCVAVSLHLSATLISTTARSNLGLFGLYMLTTERTQGRHHGETLLPGLLPASYPTNLLIPPSNACPGVARITVGWALWHQRAYLPSGQYSENVSPVEVCSSPVILVCVKLSKLNITVAFYNSSQRRKITNTCSEIIASVCLHLEWGNSVLLDPEECV